MELKLHSPVSAPPITFQWPSHYDVSEDIIQTMRWVCKDVPNLTDPLNNILRNYDSKRFNPLNTLLCRDECDPFESITFLCDRFNCAIDTILALQKGTSLSTQRLNEYPSRELLRHVLKVTYNQSVTDPNLLNHYEPFSPQVYGETSYDLVCSILDEIEIDPDAIFIDLGSGVGQVVLQIAAGSRCKLAIGIEKQEIASHYAEAMDKYFRTMMQWYGKKFGEYELIKGDFLDEEHRQKITSASVVFANNLKFSPEVDEQIKDRLADLEEKAYVVSSKNFCKLNFQISHRNSGNIGSIMHVRKMKPMCDAVSWTAEPTLFYLHQIDRSKLQKFYEGLQRPLTDTSGGDDLHSSKPCNESTAAKCVSQEPTVDNEPNVPQECQNALDKFLSVQRDQYMAMFQRMSDPKYKRLLEVQVQQERQRCQELQQRSAQLETQVTYLKNDQTQLLLQSQPSQQDTPSTGTLIATAIEMQRKHCDLINQMEKLNNEIAWLSSTNKCRCLYCSYHQLY